MSHQSIARLQEGAAVQQYFLVRQAETRTDKSGKPYLSLVLGDASGLIPARVWNRVLAKCPGPFAPGDHVGVQGQVESYQGELQLNINYINTVEALRALGKTLEGYEPELLYLSTPYDRQKLWEDLWQLAETQISPPLKDLVLDLLKRHREDLLICPAARLYHHPYLGGLLEHTWFVARHTLASLSIYPDLNQDLALAGAILHDLGKIKEIANPQAPELTAPGQLLGHIVLGWDLVRRAAQDLNFPDPILLVQLEHIILSHHGSLEFGSPIPPKTREALLVNFLDDLDAKLKMMSQHLESDSGEGDFTRYHRVLQRGLYKGGSPAPAETPPDQHNEN
ncbi:MAG: HD domain-containing protein [Deltaproteobacteria bacterium]